MGAPYRLGFYFRRSDAPVSFRDVAENLRQSFRTLAEGRPGAEVVELAGVSIASLGVAFQMFNAAFLSEPVETQQELEDRLRTAAGYFDSRRTPVGVLDLRRLAGRCNPAQTLPCVPDVRFEIVGGDAGHGHRPPQAAHSNAS